MVSHDLIIHQHVEVPCTLLAELFWANKWFYNDQLRARKCNSRPRKEGNSQPWTPWQNIFLLFNNIPHQVSIFLNEFHALQSIQIKLATTRNLATFEIRTGSRNVVLKTNHCFLLILPCTKSISSRYL